MTDTPTAFIGITKEISSCKENKGSIDKWISVYLRWGERVGELSSFVPGKDYNIQSGKTKSLCRFRATSMWGKPQLVWLKPAPKHSTEEASETENAQG